MDPVTIAASIAAVKGVLKTAKDVKQIGTALGDLFHNQAQHDKKKTTKKKPKTRMQQVLRIRAGDEDYDDDTSISAVATDVLAEKQNYLALQGLAKEIDVKWGKGTWSSIKDEQVKRVKERKEANKKAKKRAREQAEEDKKLYKKVAIETGKGLFLLCFVSGLIWWFIYILESKA